MKIIVDMPAQKMALAQDMLEDVFAKLVGRVQVCYSCHSSFSLEATDDVECLHPYSETETREEATVIPVLGWRLFRQVYYRKVTKYTTACPVCRCQVQVDQRILGNWTR